MNYTTNYNLQLPEGTDLVNPLVDTNPNFTTIDTAMKNNKDASVGVATEVKTGTVHALTRANTANNTFRFVATSVFTAGDTFTVDGVAVTAVLPSGEALASGAYIIGSNVLCILTSTQLTLMVPGGTVANALQLNSQAPSYYLTAANESYNNTVSGLTASNTQAAIDEIVSSFVSVSGTTASVEEEIAAGTAFENRVDVSRAGYTPIGVVGVSHSGTAHIRLTISYFRVLGSEVVYCVRNNANQSATLSSITFQVLYVKR